MEQAYFLTVDWCDRGWRGIFCDAKGRCFRKDNEPHTEREMYTILGLFTLILAPKSELFTAEQLSEYNLWLPLKEYYQRFGIALKKGRTGRVEANGYRKSDRGIIST